MILGTMTLVMGMVMVTTTWATFVTSKKLSRWQVNIQGEGRAVYIHFKQCTVHIVKCSGMHFEQRI